MISEVICFMYGICANIGGSFFWIYVGKYIPYMDHMEHMGKMYSPRSGPGQFLRFMTDRFKGTRVRVLKEELRNCRNEKRRLPHLFYAILFILIPKKEGTPLTLTHYPPSFWKAFGFPSFVKHAISLRQSNMVCSEIPGS